MKACIVYKKPKNVKKYFLPMLLTVNAVLGKGENTARKDGKLLQKNLEVKKKVVPLHSRLRKGGLDRDETQQQVH